MNRTNNLTCTIDCKDIILREYRLTDLEALYRITQELQVLRYLPDWNASKEQRSEWLSKYEIVENNHFLQRIINKQNIGKLRLRLAIEFKETGDFIGWCCTGIKEELPPPNREIMYAVSNAYTNKGFATQAVQGLSNYLFQNTELDELNIIALTTNAASNRVIEKAGYEDIGTFRIESNLYKHYKAYKSIAHS